MKLFSFFAIQSKYICCRYLLLLLFCIIPHMCMYVCMYYVLLAPTSCHYQPKATTSFVTEVWQCQGLLNIIILAHTHTKSYATHIHAECPRTNTHAFICLLPHRKWRNRQTTATAKAFRSGTCYLNI